MATEAQKAKEKKLKLKSKYKTRPFNRCKVCGRPRAYFSDFGLCRICLRNAASKGDLAGVKKASW
jgi:small subunit ribosomal protein S14